jgi:hypothetical protein
MAGKFNNGDLHAEANSEIGSLVCASPLGSFNHTFCIAVAEPTRHKNAICGTYFMPGFVKAGRILDAGSVNLDQVQFLAAAHGRMF